MDKLKKQTKNRDERAKDGESFGEDDDQVKKDKDDRLGKDQSKKVEFDTTENDDKKKSNGEQKVKVQTDLDDKYGTNANLEPLESAEDAFKVINNKINITASIVKADEIKKANEERLKLALSSGGNLQPLNGWGVGRTVQGHQVYRIVKVIPSLVKLKVSKFDLNTSLSDPDASGYSKYPLIRDSMQTFSGNLQKVDYIIDSTGTFEKVYFNDSDIPQSTLILENFEISPENQDGIEDYKTRTRVLSGLLELIFKVRKSADVFIVPDNYVTYGSMAQTSGEVAILMGSKQADGGQPSVYLGVFAHELTWFREDITNQLNADQLCYGETGETHSMYGCPLKMFSYYGTTTDSLFATLHYFFMNQFEQYRLHSRDFINNISIFAPLGGSIHLNTDSQVDLHHILGLSKTMIDQYRFMYMLSPMFRTHITSSMVNMAINMRGFTTVPSTDVSEVFETTAVNINNASVFSNQVAAVIRPLSIDHFYEIMGMELFHATQSPSNVRRSGYASYQDAAVSLLSIGLDALLTPNTFWSNVGLFSKAIYDAIKILDIRGFSHLMKQGYTRNHKYIVDLRKEEVLQGEVPYLFTDNNQHSVIKNFVKALDPCGKLINLTNAGSEINANFTKDKSFYVPWDFRKRNNFSSIGDSPLSYAVDSLVAVITEFINIYQKRNRVGNAEIGAILTLMTQITTERGKILGSVLHCEGNLIMRQIAMMPWVLYSTYRGESKPNLSNFIGLWSTKHPKNQGLICNDPNVHYPHGIGLWALMNLQSPQISKIGKVSGDGSFPLIIPDPITLYKNYENDVRHSILFGEGYGFMSMILNSYESEEIEFAFLFEVLGSHLRAGTAIQILNWLLPNGVEPIISFNNGERTVLKRPDMRLRDPGITQLDTAGFRVDPDNDGLDDGSDIFHRPLLLLDEYEKKKFKVAATMIADQISPLHSISRGLTFAQETFSQLTPDNRHSMPDAEIIYQESIFPIKLVDGRSKICFNYNGMLYVDPTDVMYPKNVRVEVLIPIAVKTEIWDYLKENVMQRGWQIYFPQILFSAKIEYVASSRLRKQFGIDKYWDILTGSKYGEVLEIVFFDTTSDVLNSLLQISRSAYVQEICAIDTVRRNVVLRNAYGLSRPPSYVSINKDMWTIGKTEPTSIPTDANGRQKFKLPYINFNNYLKVYTENVVIGDFPPMRYVPPLIQDVLVPF